jgi:hypothetical protein
MIYSGVVQAQAVIRALKYTRDLKPFPSQRLLPTQISSAAFPTKLKYKNVFHFVL